MVIFVWKDLFYANESAQTKQNIQQGRNEPHKAEKRKGLKNISNRPAKIVKAYAKDTGIQKGN